MLRLLLQGSGMVTMTAKGSSMPFMSRNSRVLSSMAESEPPWLTMGKTFVISSFRYLLLMVSSRASMVSTFPRMVLISPLWRM